MLLEEALRFRLCRLSRIVYESYNKVIYVDRGHIQ
jgi:hypothetical protein